MNDKVILTLKKKEYDEEDTDMKFIVSIYKLSEDDEDGGMILSHSFVSKDNLKKCEEYIKDAYKIFKVEYALIWKLIGKYKLEGKE